MNKKENGNTVQDKSKLAMYNITDILGCVGAKAFSRGKKDGEKKPVVIYSD